MRGWVRILASPVARARNHAAITRERGANRHFAARLSRERFRESGAHGILGHLRTYRDRRGITCYDARKPEASRVMSDLRAEAAEVREGQRISKIMARAGLCSRRDAEAWIEAGRVSVNGKVLATPAFNVGPDDDVTVDGERLRAPERTRLFFFHKPRGLVTSARDPEGRATIFDALPKDLPRVVSVGRLDINTEGLLLLTNDGGLARVLELPATGWLRRYRVRAHGAVTEAQLAGLANGVSIEGIHYAGIEARLERTQGSNVWLTMGLREGKNREIKRVLESLSLSVNRLIRISFGPFELADLAEGEVVE